MHVSKSGGMQGIVMRITHGGKKIAAQIGSPFKIQKSITVVCTKLWCNSPFRQRICIKTDTDWCTTTIHGIKLHDFANHAYAWINTQNSCELVS